MEDLDIPVKNFIMDDFCCEVLQQSSQMLFTESISRENTAIFSGMNTHQKPTNDTWNFSVEWELLKCKKRVKLQKDLKLLKLS